MTWASTQAPGVGPERNIVLNKLNAGLTEDEQRQVADLMPFDEYEIIRKPRTKISRRKSARAPARHSHQPFAKLPDNGMRKLLAITHDFADSLKKEQ